MTRNERIAFLVKRNQHPLLKNRLRVSDCGIFHPSNHTLFDDDGSLSVPAIHSSLFPPPADKIRMTRIKRKSVNLKGEMKSSNSESKSSQAFHPLFFACISYLPVASGKKEEKISIIPIKPRFFIHKDFKCNVLFCSGEQCSGSKVWMNIIEFVLFRKEASGKAVS